MLAMETLMKKQEYYTPNRVITSQPLSMHKNSRVIAKAKPKIRIIHIFAPEIIKTDVANFRELVQRLTGKPTPHELNKQKKKIKPRPKRMEIRPSRFSEFRERVKGEEEIWGGSINQDNGGGFMAGFADLDGFMQELNEYQMLPIDTETN